MISALNCDGKLISKRVFDVFFSLLGLFVFFPFFVVASIWIKLDSVGPIFFRQERLGRDGKAFRIFKFRTMVADADKKGSQITVGNDVRITRSGRFLRKTKLDELPQLIDVLCGKMSLVGPRPEVPEFMNLYPEVQRKKILSVRPGVTDRASILMVDENKILDQYDDPRQAYIDVIMPMKAKYYLEYVDNHNFWDDVKIVFLTFKKVVTR